jgi:hypothetical protein
MKQRFFITHAQNFTGDKENLAGPQQTNTEACYAFVKT